jgi:hypothetical protein
MLKWIILILGVVVAAFLLFSVEHGRSLRRAGFINGYGRLLAAQADYAKHGHFTNFSNGTFQMWMTTNAVTIGGTQYQCFAEVAGGWGWEGGTLAMMTNQTLIWRDAQVEAKIITLGHRPPLFGRLY